MLEFVQQVVSTGMSHDVARHYVFHKLTCYACKGYGPVVTGDRSLPFLVYWYHVCIPPIVQNEACVVGSLEDDSGNGCNAGCEGRKDPVSYTVLSGSFVHFKPLHHPLHSKCRDLDVSGDFTKYGQPVPRPDPTWGVGIAHFQLWGWRYPSCAQTVPFFLRMDIVSQYGEVINSINPRDSYMHHWPGSPLTQVMA